MSNSRHGGNRKTQVELPAGTIVTCGCSPHELRASRADDGEIATYVLGEKNLLLETDVIQGVWIRERDAFGNLFCHPRNDETVGNTTMDAATGADYY